MSLTVHVIRPEDFLRLKSDGYLDFPESKKLLFQIGTMMKTQGIDYAILDLRQARGSTSVTELYELATTLDEAGFQPSYHLAILYGADPEEKVRFFSLCASNRGWQIGAFATFEEAFEWLNKSQEIAMEPAEPQTG